jgi:hypothetical protein
VQVQLVDEISQVFDWELPRRTIELAVSDATADLKGSVAAESLPEMAVRLAVVRLDRRQRYAVSVGAGRLE